MTISSSTVRTSANLAALTEKAQVLVKRARNILASDREFRIPKVEGQKKAESRRPKGFRKKSIIVTASMFSHGVADWDNL
jgi:hypothetical protein